MTNYLKYLKESWGELEKRFRSGECYPQQENDVVCYLYHALINRLEEEREYPKEIRTEDHFSGIGRIDMNIGNRLLVEVKLRRWRTIYSDKGWKRERARIKDLAKKLMGSVNNLNSSHIRAASNSNLVLERK